jgi:hypothetical protein
MGKRIVAVDGKYGHVWPTERKDQNMLKAIAEMESISPYSQSRPIRSERQTGESHEAFENRTWRERMHVDDDGEVFIPPMAMKNAFPEIAKFLGESVPGKGKATWTKHFEAGLMVVEPIGIGVRAEHVSGERLFVPASGKRGDGSRVWKTFPLINEWRGTAEILVLDPRVISDIESHKKTESAFYRHLCHAGKFIGLGRFRPRNNGFYGRFKVNSFEIVTME